MSLIYFTLIYKYILVYGVKKKNVQNLLLTRNVDSTGDRKAE